MQGAECCDKATESFSVSAALLRLLASFRSSFWFCRTFPPQYSGRLLTSIVISYESIIKVRKKIKSPQQIAHCHRQRTRLLLQAYICALHYKTRK